MSTGSTKAVIIALAANGGIAMAKSVAAAITGSGSLFSEALHSWADCLNQILLLIGMKQAQKSPDQDHPMGYATAPYFFTMTVGVLLFFGAGLSSIQHGWHALHNPEPVSYLGLSIVVLLIAVALESYSFYGALKGMESEKGDKTLWQWFKTTRQAELMVVAAEDIAALMGLLIALVALVLTAITHNPLFDALGSVAVGVLLLFVSFAVLKEVKAMITGESVGAEKEKAIRDFILAQPEVQEIYNMITQQRGTEIMLAIKLRFKPTGSEDSLIRNISVVEEKVQTKFDIKWSFFEADNKEL